MPVIARAFAISLVSVFRSPPDKVGDDTSEPWLIWRVGCRTWGRRWWSGFQGAHLLDHAFEIRDVFSLMVWLFSALRTQGRHR
jgi:hypothetical protein